MKLPRVYPLTIPSSHRMIRMIAIVARISVLLRASRHGALGGHSSNRCATRGHGAAGRAVLIVLLVFGCVSGARAQTGSPTPPSQPATPSEHPLSSLGSFLAGGAIGLGAHESGHLLFDGIFDANPGIKKVSFHGLPFFAITHDSGLPPRQDFVIDSAGFWVQEATNEWLLTTRPDLRRERAPLAKGVFAFNVGASIAY